MALSVFEDPAQAPSPNEVRDTLGPSAPLWDALIRHAHSACAPLSELWNYSGAKFGWSLRLKQKERIILYLTPQRGAFLAGLVLGERAAQSAEAGALPPAARAALAAAAKNAEGRGIRLSVNSNNALEAVQTLLAFKLLPATSGGSRKAAGKPKRA